MFMFGKKSRDVWTASRRLTSIPAGWEDGLQEPTPVLSAIIPKEGGAGGKSDVTNQYIYVTCAISYVHLVGESTKSSRQDEILLAPQRSLPPLSRGTKIRYGTLGHGMDLPRLVWSEEDHVFSSQDADLQSRLPYRPHAKEISKDSGRPSWTDKPSTSYSWMRDAGSNERRYSARSHMPSTGGQGR